MQLNTMAAVMTFVTKIESDSLSFYHEHAQKFPEIKDVFLLWVKENKRFEKQVKQTYYGVITDTLESNYAFEGLNTDDFVFDATLTESTDLSDVIEKARSVEVAMRHFYEKAAQVSDGLMADIPRLFKKIVKKREERLSTLDSFTSEQG